ncbi:MAG: hypothetical protein CK425_11560 [Parachlamydia sp.]|nr:MAG: hypothetical protein CK425_11560 [Parachlamydia sp.]
MSISYLSSSAIPDHYKKIDDAPKSPHHITHQANAYNLAGRYSVKGASPSLLRLRGAILSLVSAGIFAFFSKNVRENLKGRKLQIIYLPEAKPKPPEEKPKSRETKPKLPSLKKSSLPMDDSSIIKQLNNQGFSSPVDKGGGGRCLFLSIAPQITQADFLEAAAMPHLQPLLSSFPDWQNLSAHQQADLLRTLALEAESHFFNTLPTDSKDLKPDDWDWIRELYKDMLQEIQHLTFANIREQAAKATDLEKFDYCKMNFAPYKSRTIRPTNWAGTSELIALSKIFNRQTLAFGQDYASSEKVWVDPHKNILPYHQRLVGRTPPIAIFQTHGGGHYRLLPLKD